jgi:beta-glucuronidase
VTNTLKAGTNQITIRADNRHSNETLPASDFDWQNYGGVTRSVWLVETDATFIRDWFIRLERGRLIADIELDGVAAANADVEIRNERAGVAMRGRSDARTARSPSAAAFGALVS